MVAVPPLEEAESPVEHMAGAGVMGKAKENAIEPLCSPFARMHQNRGANARGRVVVPRTVSKVVKAVGVVAGRCCRHMVDTAPGMSSDTHKVAAAADDDAAAGGRILPGPYIDVLALVRRSNVAD